MSPRSYLNKGCRQDQIAALFTDFISPGGLTFLYINE